MLFWIDRPEKPALDQAEARGRGYDKTTVDIITDSGTEQAPAHVASAGATDPVRRPYDWYKVLVVAGAIQPGLSADCIARLRAVQSQDDLMPKRRTKREAEAALAASGIVVGWTIAVRAEAIGACGRAAGTARGRRCRGPGCGRPALDGRSGPCRTDSA